MNENKNNENAARDAEQTPLIEAGHVTGYVKKARVWVVTAPSAYRIGHTCFLGRGATKQAALEDAYGPKQGWGNATRKSMRIADVQEVDADEADSMEFYGDNQ
jgi:hypothetical protein